MFQTLKVLKAEKRVAIYKVMKECKPSTLKQMTASICLPFFLSKGVTLILQKLKKCVKHMQVTYDRTVSHK